MGMLVFVVAVASYTALAAVTDARTHRIPNYLTVPSALLGLAYHAVLQGSAGMLTALAGFGVGFLLLLIPWLFGGGGMGDVKLLAALGAWLGPWWLLVAFAVSSGMALLLALVLIANRTPFRRQGSSAAKRSARGVPFAVPVALSTWALLTWFVTRGGL